MLVVHVHVHVKPEFVERFREATVENARQSLSRARHRALRCFGAGVRPGAFCSDGGLSNAGAAAAHKATAHYQVWRDTVAEMMAEPRTSLQFTNVFPEEEAW